MRDAEYEAWKTYKALMDERLNSEPITYRKSKTVATETIYAHVGNEAMDKVLEALGLDTSVGTITLEPTADGVLVKAEVKAE